MTSTGIDADFYNSLVPLGLDGDAALMERDAGGVPIYGWLVNKFIAQIVQAHSPAQPFGLVFAADAETLAWLLLGSGHPAPVVKDGLDFTWNTQWGDFPIRCVSGVHENCLVCFDTSRPETLHVLRNYVSP